MICLLHMCIIIILIHCKSKRSTKYFYMISEEINEKALIQSTLYQKLVYNNSYINNINYEMHYIY